VVDLTGGGGRRDVSLRPSMRSVDLLRATGAGDDEAIVGERGRGSGATTSSSESSRTLGSRAGSVESGVHGAGASSAVSPVDASDGSVVPVFERARATALGASSCGARKEVDEGDGEGGSGMHRGLVGTSNADLEGVSTIGRGRLGVEEAPSTGERSTSSSSRERMDGGGDGGSGMRHGLSGNTNVGCDGEGAARRRVGVVGGEEVSSATGESVADGNVPDVGETSDGADAEVLRRLPGGSCRADSSPSSATPESSGLSEARLRQSAEMSCAALGAPSSAASDAGTAAASAASRTASCADRSADGTSPRARSAAVRVGAGIGVGVGAGGGALECTSRVLPFRNGREFIGGPYTFAHSFYLRAVTMHSRLEKF
jgi:hypothetical protein